MFVTSIQNGVHPHLISVFDYSKPDGLATMLYVKLLLFV